MAMQRLCKDNVAQIAIFEIRDGGPAGSGQKICVSNTHIFWDPDYADVKLWQAFTLASELDRFTLSRELPLILCGDFNSEPDSSVRHSDPAQRCDATETHFRGGAGEVVRTTRPRGSVRLHIPVAR